MGLFSDIISAVGNVGSDIFGGGSGSNDDNQKRKQQNAPAPQQGNNLSGARLSLPTILRAPANNNNNMQAPKPLTPVFTQPTQTPTNLTSQPPASSGGESLFGHLLHGAEDVGEGAAGVGAAAAAGTLRAGEGAVSAAESLPNMAIHIATKPIRAIAGPDSGVTHVLNSVDQQSQRLTNDAQDPVNFLAQKTDMIPGMFNHENGDSTITGRVAADLYKPAQIAANVATVVPAAAAVAGKIGEAGNVASKVADFAEGQSAIPTLSKVPGLGSVLKATGLGDEAEGTQVEKAPTETGTKAVVDKPANAPAGEVEGVPQTEPGAIESGVKPVASQTDEPPAAPETSAPAISPAPSIKETGDPLTDLGNAAAAHQHTLDNGVQLGNNTGLKGLLDRVNEHFTGNNVISSAFHKALDTVLTKDQQANVQEALQTGNVNKLTGNEAAVAKALQEQVHNPADVLRSSTDDQYTSKANYSPQVGQGGKIVDAAKGASKATGSNIIKSATNKVNTFNDLLQKSKFSQTSTLGKFTSTGGKTLYGDANDLGLHVKGDSTIVDDKGNVYTHSPASNAEITAHNPDVKLQGLSDATHTYMNDNMNLKVRTQAADEAISNPEKYGLNEKATVNDQPSVVLKGSDGTEHEFFTDKDTQKAMQESGVAKGGASAHTNLATTLFNKATSGITQLVVANPVVHGANQLVQGMVASGIENKGIGGLSFLKNSFGHTADDELAAARAGVHLASFGKNIEGTLSKLTFGASKLSEKAMSAVDGNFRIGAWKSLVKNGMDPEEAATRVNQFMGDRHVFDNAQPHVTMFMKYLKTEFSSAGRTVGLAAKGHPGALVNASMAAAATYGLQKAFQDFTGNQNASIHAPGMVGAAEDAYKLADGLATGKGLTEAKNVATSHINPLVSQMAEQALNSNGYGDKIPGSTGGSILSELAARGKFAAASIPGTNLLVNDGHSAAEKLMNTFGLYTPHIAGDMATDNPKLAPVLNVKNAQNGSSTAFPKDFTGEQEENAVNQLGGNYSTKSAAIMGTQTQNQQKAYVAATSELKKVGVTDADDVQSFSKLSGKDQISYIKAATSLNTAGTAISNTSIQSQLVKEGNISLAASMNKDIPSQLPPEAKTTLETYSTLGTGGQKDVWLQNNGNADNYYKAVIAQKQAQGALTTDDTDTGATWSGSGNSLYVKALVAETDQKNNVSQETQELYKNTDLTKYKDMTGAEKTALTTYAQQLNAAGVMDKYDLYEGGDSSSSDDSGYSDYSDSSSGSSASDLDRAAGMPDGTQTLLKPKDNSNLKAADTAKYVAPKLLDDKPSSHNGNPFIRSISVSKGLK
jgi:hypothetical protein